MGFHLQDFKLDFAQITLDHVVVDGLCRWKCIRWSMAEVLPGPAEKIYNINKNRILGDVMYVPTVK